MTDNVSVEQLRLFIERIERLEEEKKGIADDIKDVYLEAKSQGFDPKTIKSPLYVRHPDKGYIPLDAALYRRIAQEKMKL